MPERLVHQRQVDVFGYQMRSEPVLQDVGMPFLEWQPGRTFSPYQCDLKNSEMSAISDTNCWTPSRVKMLLPL